MSDVAGASTRPTTATLRALLAGIVDYAGLFPPAGLGMPEAVANYARYLAGPDRWALGRFVLPAARLAEFDREADALLPTGADAQPWRLSALVDAERGADLRAVRDFNARHATDGARRAVVDSLEGKAATPEEITRFAGAARDAGSRLELFVELPLSGDLHALVHAVREAGARAKARTGGVTADAFPATERLAKFIAACVRAGVPFKATAGLHHPVRASYRLTYSPDSASATMFGFLNVFVGAALLHAGMPERVLPALLEETSPGAIRFDEHAVTWREWRADRDALAAARHSAALSFGSCSFEEPMGELRGMGLL